MISLNASNRPARSPPSERFAEHPQHRGLAPEAAVDRTRRGSKIAGTAIPVVGLGERRRAAPHRAGASRASGLSTRRASASPARRDPRVDAGGVAAVAVEPDQACRDAVALDERARPVGRQVVDDDHAGAFHALRGRPGGCRGRPPITSTLL